MLSHVYHPFSTVHCGRIRYEEDRRSEVGLCFVLRSEGSQPSISFFNEVRWAISHSKGFCLESMKSETDGLEIRIGLLGSVICRRDLRFSFEKKQKS